jgi:hypothetical protein
MSSMPWVKLFTEMLDDVKLGRLTDRHRWRFVALILLAGECDAEGYLVSGESPMSMDDIAWRFRMDVEQLAEEMNALTNIGLLDNTETGWRVCKFSERQGRSQSEKREQWRTSKAKIRAESKGPEWPEMSNESPIGHQKDTNESPTPREEKSRGKKNTGAVAPGETDPVKELAAIFEQAAGVKESDIPKKSQGATFWSPLSYMVKIANGRAPDLLRATVKKMRAGGLTLSSPNSCLKTFTALNGERTTGPVTPESRTPAL